MLTRPFPAVSRTLARLRWAEGYRPPWAHAWIELFRDKDSVPSGGLDAPGNGSASLGLRAGGNSGDKGCAASWEMPYRLWPGLAVDSWVAEAVGRWRRPGRFCSCSPFSFAVKGTSSDRWICWRYTEKFLSFLCPPRPYAHPFMVLCFC